MMMMNYRALWLWLSIAIVFSVQSCRALAAGEGSKEADKIAALPGQPPDVKLQQYSGYINVNETSGKSLFYYFVEASVDAAHKPLLLWLNGGPGCSSMGIGAFQEIGPFRVDTDGKTLCRNPHSWITAANLLFLESPVGVGFSYAAVKPQEVYSTIGDNMTAHDSHTFLLRWLDRFPEYKTRDLFIVGESYAGHYVPELAVTILDNNLLPHATPIKLKGIAIGNGILEFAAEQTQLYEYLWQHAFISDSAHALITQSCKYPDDHPSALCESARKAAYSRIGNIDIYNIYSSTCHEQKVRPSASKCMDLADPCSQYFVEAYMNQPQVQKTIHANTELKYPWTRCRVYNLDHFGDSPKSMLPYIKAVITGRIRIWIFSGDLDAMVPVTATRQSMERLQLRVAADWRPWSADGKDVAGYVIAYDGLVFATVRGSGHMAPIDQPERALVLVSSFIRGQPLPPPQPQHDA
ncbi:serine carboxypeptidase 1-like isoform X1 [Oryza glaberrima]|uniref:Carboxypeptidase n=1 Tax=Oryza glaberrima TaxID=4538 RepID=I1P8F2_ORYGL|nr:serine carboxypeptidase 1-like isoform X1 [Oryza glaberrima]